MSETGPVAQYYTPEPTPKAPATFYGTTYHKVADKTNQVAVPRPFKRSLDDAREALLVLIQYPEEPYLRLYTKKAFDEKMAEVKSNADFSVEDQNAIVDWMAGESQVVEPDSQGRFVLPKEFAETLKSREVAFQGAHTFIKVWPAELHQAAKHEAQNLSPVMDLVRGILNR
jgi:MraZ protein